MVLMIFLCVFEFLERKKLIQVLSYRGKMFGDKAIDKWRSVEVSGMSFYQYIEAPLTTRNILSLSGELSTQNGTGILKYSFSSRAVSY